MATGSQHLTVMEIAKTCGVARSTVSYWISKKSLSARRSGKKHLVSVDDLVLFLTSERQTVPHALLEQVGGVYPQPFRPFKRCWEYWGNDSHGDRCRHCTVFELQIKECFTISRSSDRQCSINCHECQYFGEYYGLPVAFIHQIGKPAAVYKDLSIWTGNRAWAQLCAMEAEELIGVGMEEFVHPESLKMFIRYSKGRVQSNPTVPERYRGIFHSGKGGKIDAYLTVTSLLKPVGTCLAIAERAE
jgi:excisionase family DNA binding protein